MHDSGLLLPLLASLLLSQETRPVAEPPWAAPPLERAVSVVDGRSGESVAFSTMLDALAEADAVFVGETHTDETTHRVELGVFEGIAERRSGQVVLAMEMFERDVQPALDAYLAGETSEQEFLAASRPWTNYDSGYRPLIEFAKQQGLPVLASNFPKPLIRRLAMMGEGAGLDALEGEEREQAPRELFANSPDYWRRVDNAIRGHIGMMGGQQGDDERLYSTQSLWDNSMGEVCARALNDYPDRSVVHVNGGFHSAYWDGTVRQFRLRKPDAKVLTIAVSPVTHPSVVKLRGAPVADYVVFAETRATDLNEGTYGVYAQREIDYRFHLPEEARAGSEVPLLIWLADDGFTAEGGMQLWRKRLGEECAIAVVEAPHRETQGDLMLGGRWFWPDSFMEDMGSLQDATEKVWAFLLRHYPIDSERVCLAGEGSGATVAASVALFTDRIGARAVGFRPRRYAKLKDLPLPLPELRGDDSLPAKSLELLLAPQDEEWWAAELSEYQGIGFESSSRGLAEDPWLQELEQESTVRAALGLPVSEPAAEAPRRHIVATSPRARLWARLAAADRFKEDGALIAVLDAAPAEASSTAIDLDFSPGTLAESGGIPRCPGPFGGTTVLVIPADIGPEELEAWRQLQENDPLNKKSRFHRLRIATTGGEGDLPTVLNELVSQNRKNVLIVPAAFCADAETMRALERSTHGLEDRMTLHWRPGLGG